MSWLKTILGDIRNTIVSMITVSAILILAPIATGIWKLIQEKPVPWAILISCGAVGSALLMWALIKLSKHTESRARAENSLSLDVMYDVMNLAATAEIPPPKQDESRWKLAADALSQRAPFVVGSRYREEHAKAIQQRYSIAMKVCDLSIRSNERSLEKRYDLLGALIKYAGEIHSEEDLLEIENTLRDANEGVGPFDYLLCRFGLTALDNQKLQFIRDARLSGRDTRLDAQVGDYMFIEWAPRRGLNPLPNPLEGKEKEMFAETYKLGNKRGYYWVSKDTKPKLP